MKVTLEEISADLINEAHAQWVAEDDGTDDYPTLGEVLSVRFGVPAIEVVRAERDALREKLARARKKTLKMFGL